MGRKRQFINKRDAHKFVLMHRSQQDPEYYREGGSKFVLHPADAATARALHKLGLGDDLVSSGGMSGGADADAAHNSSNLRNGELREVDELGLPIDGYNYHKHLAAIDGSGTFVSASGSVLPSRAVAPADLAGAASAGKKSVKFADEVEEDGDTESLATGASTAANKAKLTLPRDMFASDREYDRMLEAITLNPNSLDPEMKRLLELGFDEEVATDDGEDDDDEEYVGTLEDDFMQQLLQAEADAPEEDVFDFDAHMARLMAQAEAEDGYADDDDDDDDDFDEEDLKELMAQASGSRQLRDIDLHFEAVLARDYDDDEIGELDHRAYDERVAGTVELSAAHVQHLVETYLKEKRADKERGHEIGANEENIALKESNKRLVSEGDDGAKQSATLDEEVDDTPKLDSFGNGELADTIDYAPDVTKDEILHHFGYDDRPQAKWDCETIVSTYSVLDNHPTLIPVESRRKRKNAKAKSVATMKVQEEVDEDHEEVDEALETAAADFEHDQAPPPADEDVDLDGFVGLSAGLALPTDDVPLERTKEESVDEKRARKKLVKMQQRLRRQEKKTTKDMFKQEKKRQQNAAQKLKQAAAPPPGATVLHF